MVLMPASLSRSAMPEVSQFRCHSTFVGQPRAGQSGQVSLIRYRSGAPTVGRMPEFIIKTYASRGAVGRAARHVGGATAPAWLTPGAGREHGAERTRAGLAMGFNSGPGAWVWGATSPARPLHPQKASQ